MFVVVGPGNSPAGSRSVENKKLKMRDKRGGVGVERKGSKGGWTLTCYCWASHQKVNTIDEFGGNNDDPGPTVDSRIYKQS